MIEDDIKTMKRKIDAIITNISLYQRDIKTHMKKLKSNYGIGDIENINDIIKELEFNIKILNKQEQKLLIKASRLLNK